VNKVIARLFLEIKRNKGFNEENQLDYET